MTLSTCKKTILKGGTIVLPDRLVGASLVIENGIIKGITNAKIGGDYEIVDVTGKVLMPGVIDSHVHMWDPSPLNYREDWYHGSQAAAAGGITTIVEMPLSVPPVTDRHGFELKKEVASKDSFVDFALWGGLIPSCIDKLEELNDLGCVAYKGFMSFANPDYPQITDGYLVKGMREVAKFDGLIGVHAENAEVADFGSKHMSDINCKDESMHDEARPWWAELEAIQRAVLFSKVNNSRLLICHMTIAEGAEYLKKAKMEGVKVSVETCPHYLLFDKNILRDKKSYAKCNPPLRSRENVEKLWDYIFDGTIDIIGSDHGPYSDEEKVKEGSFWNEYSGFGGFDAMLSGLITEGVHKRGLPLSHLSKITSENTARIMGLYPKKGSLLPGSDADVLVVDLNEEWIYDGMKSFSKTKSNKGIYQDMKFKGKVEKTLVRGELVYDNGMIVGKQGYGQYVPKQNQHS
ncbi:allantoinase AllB [Paratissierella segnis]|jgi:allantoinase|uniref:allantoinase n=1 Tax=Paratissierella segnis TaxID=2763679 RepID=A0A926EW47_9FIRM|nr:allantoinase AllB [Paratissierella segnis]MBC8588617.1 allantoinase AllB [Paratissierella segnis]